MNRMQLKVIVLSMAILFSSLACSLVTDMISDANQEPVVVNEPAPTESVQTSQDQPEQSSEAGQGQEQTQAEPSEELASENSGQPEGDGLIPPPSNNDVCNNVFYPLIPGYQWIYEVTSEGETSQIGLTVSEQKENQAILNALYLDSGVTTELTVDCQNGAIVNFPILLLGFLFGDVEGEMNLEHKSGVFMPSYATFTASNWDYTWISQYTASGKVEAVVEGDQVTGILEQSPLDMDWNTLGAGEAIFESVTVKAGEFLRAIKFEREATLDFTAQFVEEGQQVSLSAVLIVNTNLWYEPNVGLLKQEVDRASAKIYGINFPITMDGSIELVEFRPNE